MHSLPPTFLRHTAEVGLPVAAFAAFNLGFNRRSPKGWLSIDRLPMTLTSGGLLILPYAILASVGFAVCLYALWILATAAWHISTALRWLTAIMAIINLPLMLILFRGMIYKLFEPTLVTFGVEGITYKSFNACRTWHWNQIDHAEVRVIHAARGGSFPYPCLCLKSNGDSKSWASKWGLADTANLPALLKSPGGVENAKDVCALLNDVLAQIRA